MQASSPKQLARNKPLVRCTKETDNIYNTFFTERLDDLTPETSPPQIDSYSIISGDIDKILNTDGATCAENLLHIKWNHFNRSVCLSIG